MRRPARWIALGTGLVFLLALAATGAVGWVGSERAIHPERKTEDFALSNYSFAGNTEDVRFASLDKTDLAGWFVPSGSPAAPTIVLLHGYGRSRAELLPHADYLHQAGYNVFLLDFRNRGQSGGDAVTTGAREPMDVRGTIAYLRSRRDVDPDRIALQGVSLGASSGLIAMVEEPRVTAIVSESAFTDLEETINRSFEHFIGLPAFPFASVTILIAEKRLGVSARDVRPIDAIRKLGQRPVLIIDDLEDKEMPVKSGRRLYDAASGPKELWQIENAAHTEGFKWQPAEYKRRVLEFYANYLAAGRGGEPQP